jgi:hypothetical protein
LGLVLYGRAQAGKILPAAITGDKKLYSKDEYDSNAENKVRK